MYHAVDMLLHSELFRYHAERMSGLVMVDAQEVSLLYRMASQLNSQNTNPHELYVLYHIILYYGYRHPSLFRSHRKWKKLLPTLGEVVSVETEEVSNAKLPTNGDA